MKDGVPYTIKELPKYETSESAGMDVRTPYPFRLEVGQGELVDTGLIIEAPYAHCILVLPRSGLACKHGITIPNAPGLIDGDYCGPNDTIKIKLINNGPVAFDFKAGDRIAQFLFVNFTRVFLAPSDVARSIDRGGFGSTGVS